MKYIHRIISMLFLCLIVNSGAGVVKAYSQATHDDGWRLRKNENGIRIYSRHTSQSDIDELKVVSTMHASLSSIVAVIMDADHYSEWIYNCKEARVIKRVSATEQYQYQHMSAPAPFSDRDAVIHFTIWQNARTGVVTTKSEAVPDYLPKKEGLVRLPRFEASYLLEPLAGGNVQVTYLLSIDPGGYIPDWLVNLTLLAGPYQSTLKMREQVKKPQYVQAHPAFISEP